MDTSAPSLGPSSTDRTVALFWAVATYTQGPALPRCTDVFGTTVAPCLTSSSRRAFTNWFGKSASSTFGNSALSLTVPVVGSISLSIVKSAPAAIRFFSLRSHASTMSGGPASRASRNRCTTAGTVSSGSEKTTVIGCTAWITAIPPASAGVTLLPASTSRRPMRPVIGAVMRVNSS